MRKSILENALAVVWAAWRRRYLIAVPIIAMPIIATLFGALTPEKYKSHTTILIQESAKQNPFLKDLTVDTNLKGRMAALNALLHSRHVLADVALSLGMIDESTPDDVAARKIAGLSRALSATLVGEDLLKITYVANDVAGMEEVLRLVSVRFVERVIAPQRSSIVGSETFLEEQMEGRHSELVEAERRLADYKSLHASELPELHSSNVGRLGNLKDALAERRTALKGAEAARIEMRARLFRTNPVVGKIEEQIVGVVSELAMLRARYTDNHTKVQAALRTLRSLEQERSKVLRVTPDLQDQDLERLWNMAATSTITRGDSSERRPLLVSQLERLQEVESRASSLAEEVRSIETQIEALAAKVSGFGRNERRLGEFERDLGLKRKIYEDLAERHQLARVTGALGRAEESERVKLIDPPFTPTVSTNPPVIAFTIIGVFGGLLLGGGLGTLAEVLNLTIWRRKQLELITDVPVLVRIPPLNGPFGPDTADPFVELKTWEAKYA